MISGVVTKDREAVISLTVRGPSGEELETEAVIDTGFDGSLSLPATVISALGLPWRRRGLAQLADGSESIFDIYDAVVVWDEKRKRIAVDEAETAPLVGMSLLDGFELTMQVRVFGTVTIRQLPA